MLTRIREPTLGCLGICESVPQQHKQDGMLPATVMRKLGLIILAALIISIVVRVAEEKQTAPKPLDYSKPIYTTDFTVVCPLGVLFDTRAGHGPEAVLDLFTSISNLKSKEENLGCEEWRGGLRVDAVRMKQPADLHYVQVNGTMFTVEAHLTNDASLTN